MVTSDIYEKVEKKWQNIEEDKVILVTKYTQTNKHDKNDMITLNRSSCNGAHLIQPC